MKTKILYLVSFLTIVWAACSAYNYFKPKNELTPQEKITQSVVIVEGSSGIVIYEDNSTMLVLTAAHVVHSKDTVEPYKVAFITFKGRIKYLETEVLDSYADDDLDLAILKINTLGSDEIIPAEITNITEEPKIGETIYIASNPHQHYRSLKKGILSSKIRFGDNQIVNWEVDAMIIFGSSGGGAFTEDGKLFGIVSGIDALETSVCSGKKNEVANCLSLPLTEMGYVSTPSSIRQFINDSQFSDYFKF